MVAIKNSLETIRYFYLISICIALILFVGCNSSKDKAAEVVEEDTSVVESPEKILRSITTTRYDFEEKFGDSIPSFRYEEIQIFDKSGNMTEFAYYDSLGNPSVRWPSSKVHKEKYIFNESNKKIRESTYDVHGDYVSEDYNSWVTIVTKYDSLGNRKERIGYDKWEDITFKVTYRTDINNVKEIISYNRDGTIEGENYLKYNANGNLIEEVSYGYINDRTIKTVQNFTYNLDNKITQLTTDCNYDCYYIELYSNIWKSFYDEKGNLVEETFEYPEEEKYKNLTTRTIYKYDDKNRILEELNLDKNNEPISSSYSVARQVYNYTSDDSYEILYYLMKDEFEEKNYKLYYKELVKKEFYP